MEFPLCYTKPKNILTQSPCTPVLAVHHQAPTIITPLECLTLPTASRHQTATTHTTANNPATWINNPATWINNPATSVNNPATSINNPATSINNPATPIHNPATPINNPATPIHNPATPINNPATPIHNPATPINNPATPINNPATSTNKTQTTHSSLLDQLNRNSLRHKGTTWTCPNLCNYNLPLPTGLPICLLDHPPQTRPALPQTWGHRSSKTRAAHDAKPLMDPSSPTLSTLTTAHDAPR
ncbi:Uncharacterized protein E2P81_ATG05651 [Venturia nashicola]|nr:Uncharacterized protein E2P81_ATG05651 [Venturia nashicola]